MRRNRDSKTRGQVRKPCCSLHGAISSAASPEESGGYLLKESAVPLNAKYSAQG